MFQTNFCSLCFLSAIKAVIEGQGHGLTKMNLRTGRMYSATFWTGKKMKTQYPLSGDSVLS